MIRQLPSVGIIRIREKRDQCQSKHYLSHIAPLALYSLYIYYSIYHIIMQLISYVSCEHRKQTKYIFLYSLHKKEGNLPYHDEFSI